MKSYKLKFSGRTKIKVSFLVFILVLGFRQTTAQTICIDNTGDQKSGTSDGFYYELWDQNSQGTACMTLGSGCAFSCEWDGIYNYLARSGLKYNQTQEHQEIGTFTATYECSYNPICTSGNSYLGVYGWTYDAGTDDLVEYYIIENWCNWIPSMDASAVDKGTINIDGSTYNIITVMRYDAPSIKGDRDFIQYFSIRQSTRTSGSIHISDHFNKWESLGMEMGKMHEVSFLVEGFQNSGDADFTTLDVSVSPITLQNNPFASAASVSIYPNPGNELVTIKVADESVISSLQIIDATGRITYSADYLSDTGRLIQFEGLQPGIYLLRMKIDGLYLTQKLVVH